MKILVRDGVGFNTAADMVQTETLPAFLPDGTVCPDGEYEGTAVEQYYYNLVSEPFWIDCPEWMIELDKSTWTDHQSRQIYRCQSPTFQSPADKYIKALEGLKKKAPNSVHGVWRNDAIDEAIKTIRELTGQELTINLQQ